MKLSDKDQKIYEKAKKEEAIKRKKAQEFYLNSHYSPYRQKLNEYLAIIFMSILQIGMTLGSIYVSIESFYLNDNLGTFIFGLLSLGLIRELPKCLYKIIMI